MNKVYFLSVTISLFVTSIYGQSSLNMNLAGQYDPPNMPSTSSGVTYNDVWGYTADDGSEYAILGNVDSILVIDVSICDSPQRVFGFAGGDRSIWRDFKTYQNYLYAVCDNCTEGLQIFDMSGLPNGNVSHVLSTRAFFDDAHNIFIDTTTQKLYAAGSNGAIEGLTVLDISNPTNPTLIDDIEFDDEIGMPSANFYVHDVFVQNDTAYCSHGNTGFYVWDLTDLSSIDLLGSYDSPGYNHSSWIDGTGRYSYYAEEVPRGRPMAVIDLENLGHPIQDIQLLTTFKDPISTVENDVTPHNPFVHNDTLYISYYEDGIKVYDLINPESPTLVAYYDTFADNGMTYTGYDGNWGTYPFLPSGCILASDIEYGLNTLELVPCANPVTYYRDSDGDTYGDPNESYTGCAQAEGWVTDNTDCDDTNGEINPSAPEPCDDIDNNCNSIVDDGSSFTFYADADNDGFGNSMVSLQACNAPVGYVVDNSDCNDNDPNINPNSTEVCDNIDNNCNNIVDENCPLDPCDGINLNINPITQDTYHAKQTIDSDANVVSNQNIKYHAGQNIELNSGFEVSLGAEFLASIKDCDLTTTLFLSNPDEFFRIEDKQQSINTYIYKVYKGDELIKEYIDVDNLDKYLKQNIIEGITIKVLKQ